MNSFPPNHRYSSTRLLAGLIIIIRSVFPFVLVAACGVVSFVVYFRTLCPTIGVGDTTELITAAAVWGVPHAPGYPLYTLLAHLFTYLPFGELAWRVNLSAAVFSSVAVGLMALLLLKLTKSGWSAAGGGLVPGFC